MLFNSPEFVLFFAVTFSAFWSLGFVVPSRYLRSAQHLFLLAASYYFYMSWDAKFIFLILLITVVDFLAGLALETAKRPLLRKLIVVTSVASNLSLLVYYKYTGFFIENFKDVLSSAGIQPPSYLNIVLPIGISFYTFESLSYVIDIYRRDFPAVRDIRRYSLFITFFPHLVAGPILRASEFFNQLHRPVVFRDVPVRQAVNLILLGLIKKVLISEWVAPVSDAVFASPGEHSSFGVWIGIIAYTVQIYCDFSGYSDIAIGVARLFGYELPFNFNMPYVARSITEFWRRWHISLSSWLRDYLYITLGGNRGSRLKTYRNLFIVMFVGGLWHGASWQFVVWGCIHGVALAVERFCKEHWKALGGKIPPLLAWFATMLVVMIAWVFFRAQTFDTAFLIVKKAFVFELDGKITTGVRFFAGVILVMAGHLLAIRPVTMNVFKDYFDRSLPARAFVYASAVFLILLLAPDGNRPFIYFQF